MRPSNNMDFSVTEYEHFSVAHCYGCLVPGYLIVSPIVPIFSLAALSKNAQEELGPVLAATTEAIQSVLSPLKIYCAQFGEESQQLHFHIFPRTAEITAEFLRAFPEQRDMIHGPVLLDWARSKYRGSEPNVWAAVSPVILALQREFNRITTSSTGRTRTTRAPVS